MLEGPLAEAHAPLINDQGADADLIVNAAFLMLPPQIYKCNNDNNNNNNEKNNNISSAFNGLPDGTHVIARTISRWETCKMHE
jgi:hypothetical protein